MNVWLVICQLLPVVAYLWCCCGTPPTCGCAECTGTNNCCLQVTIAGFVNGPLTCDCKKCNDLNGVRTVKMITAVSVPNCTWSGGLCSETKNYFICGLNGLVVTIQLNGTHYWLSVFIQNTVPGIFFTYTAFTVDLGTDIPNCNSFNNLNVPFNKKYNNLDSNWGQCDYSSASAVVTSLGPTDCNFQTACPRSTKCCAFCKDRSVPRYFNVTTSDGTFLCIWDGNGCQDEFNPQSGQSCQWRYSSAGVSVSVTLGGGKIRVASFNKIWEYVFSSGELCPNGYFPDCFTIDKTLPPFPTVPLTTGTAHAVAVP